MLIGRVAPRRWRLPWGVGYLLALGAAGLAVFGRTGLQPFAPGIGSYVFLIPAVVFAGMFCGTWPAVLAAASGGLLTSFFVPGASWFAPPLFNAVQLNALLYVLACAAVIWATGALRRSAEIAELAEARLAEVFRQLPGAAAILEAPTGRLLLRSTQSDQVLGHPPLETVKTGDMSGYGGLRPDGCPMVTEDYPIFRALKTGASIGGEHIRYRRPDGSVADLEVHAGPVRGTDGKVLAAVGMAFDVTERMTAERLLREREAEFRALAERLRESESEYRTAAERLRAAIDAGGFGVWEIDLVTGRVRMDGTMAAMLGMRAEAAEVAGADMRAFIHADDYEGVRATLQAAVAASGPYAEECRMRTAQGEVRWVVSRGAVLKDMQKVIGVVRDVTQRRHREDALRAALDARDVLMREADHRIKNSLQLVASLLSLQLSKTADVATRQALGDAMARVQAVANAHLALERSSDLNMIEIDQMIADLCGRVGALNPAVVIRCEVSAGIGLGAEQAIPLGLIASEVLTNALRHAFPPGAPGDVSLTLVRRHGVIEMIIADQGTGLPAEPRRLGLGSSVIAALSRQIGAEVATRSQPGEGVVVTVRLAVATTDDALAADTPDRVREDERPIPGRERGLQEIPT